ncbi:uncharacterized protein [Ptychodera flava]|uniref:uncharacterized protein isoform X2 n=1 Tax=Ptychodera flava TaxID=63121 RepID=UPI00396A7694
MPREAMAALNGTVPVHDESSLTNEATKMKFYLHMEHPPEFTMVVKLEDQHKKVQDILKLFTENYNKKYGEMTTLQPKEIYLQTQDGKNLCPTDSVLKIKEKSDVYVHPVSGMEPTENVLKQESNEILERKVGKSKQEEQKDVKDLSESMKTNLTLQQDAGTETSSKSEKSDAKSGSHRTNPKSGAKVKKKKKKTREEAIADKLQTDYKVHMEGDSGCLFGIDSEDDVDSDPSSKHSRYKLDMVVKPGEKTISIKAEQISDEEEADDGGDIMVKAKKFLEESKCKNAKEIYFKVLEENPKSKGALMGMALVYRRAGRTEEALEYLKQADEHHPYSYRINQLLGETYLDLNLSHEAVISYTICMRSKEKMSRKRLQDIQLGLCKSFLMAGKKIEGLKTLQNLLKENIEHQKALLEYASLIYSKTPLAHKESITMALTVLTQSKGKDKEAAVILIKILRHQNGMKYLQSEIHEAWNSVSALSFLCNQLRDHGAIPEATTIIKRAVEVEPENPKPLLNLMHICEIQDKHQEAIELALDYFKKNRGLNIAGVQCSSFVPLIECVKGSIYLNDASPGTSGIIITVEYPQDRGYSEDELYVLALLFTVVKILFVKGSFRILHGINRLLDPCYKDRDLHLTLIRNEAAYYATISQLMTIDMVPLPEDKKFIYFASDSHCLTTAWRSIIYKGSPHIIHPLLATGCKIWHLRPEGTFYPKENFFNMMKIVPKRATVIFNMGEIDCREGIIFAVEKCKYDSADEGISKVVDIYLKVMKKLKSLYNLKVFVHPVNPVLDLTRSMVKKFNLALEKAVREMPGLTWLDLADELLTKSGDALDPKYSLDETHLHPEYLHLLEKAINKKHS